MSKQRGFNYVNVTSPGCKGWINLFHGNDILCLVDNVELADRIKKNVPERDLSNPARKPSRQKKTD